MGGSPGINSLSKMQGEFGRDVKPTCFRIGLDFSYQCLGERFRL